MVGLYLGCSFCSCAQKLVLPPPKIRCRGGGGGACESVVEALHREKSLAVIELSGG